MSDIIQLTTAGAGSGKTTELTRIIEDAISTGECRPEAIIGTTFTNKAAEELVERVRRRLFAAGRVSDAQRLEESLLGTVHSICARLLGRFAFEAGISPEIVVLDEGDARVLLSAAIEEACPTQLVREMERLSTRLCQRDDKTGESFWKARVGDLTKAARENGIDPARLAAMADPSIAEIIQHLPPATNSPLDEQLAAALRTALGQMEGNGDTTAKSATAKNEFEQALRELGEGRMAWAQWWRVAKADFGKTSVAAAKPAQEIARHVEEHPALRSELAEFIRGIFTVAAEALVFYQSRKEERGWLDFADLEARTLALLAHPAVAGVISDEFDLLLVDEFQDTSPLQLALFLRLAELVRVRTAWVGDVKQAIYGFRGSDPELMNAAVALVRSRDGITPPLDMTYRARPELAQFFNAVFVPAFQRTLALPANEVTLQPSRPARAELPPPIERWLLSSGQNYANGNPKPLNNDQCAVAMAEGVRRLLAGGYSVEDKHSHELRPLRARDVAVLCRKNDVAAEIAGCLVTRGIAVTRKTPGLLATPEACLALACLRRLLDPGDSLAAAEIIALDGELTAEQWLEQRLAWLEDSAPERWGLDGTLAHPSLLALEKAREHLVLFTPQEALDTAMSAGGVFRAVTAWGPTEARAAQRRANLEVLRGLAVQYEERCGTAHRPATVAGLLLWYAKLKAESLDCIAADESADAVHVVTWHGAKGLEWPVVICAEIETEPRPRLWNQVLVVQESAVDPRAPLAARRLRFWPWPFGKQWNGVPLAANVENSAAGQRAARAAIEEELRLLYVAFTRSRDVLVLPFRHGKNAAALAPLNAAAWLTLPATADEVIDGSVGEFLSRARCVIPPEAFPAQQPEPQSRWFPPGAARTPKLPAAILPHAAPPLDGASVGECIEFQRRLPIRGRCDEKLLGNALHALLAFEFLHPDDRDRGAVAERLLRAHGTADFLDAADALAMASGFRTEVARRFSPKRVFLEAPFSFRNAEGQLVNGTIDLLIESAAGWVVIDHKTFLGPSTDWPARALSHSGQLGTYRASQNALGRQPCASWIHFATTGGLVEVQ
jgi:ATP-dependent exoDNAse (exonuclease V) beta subunit